MDNNNNILLRPDEAAKQLAIGRSKLYELLSQGKLPKIVIGRSIRIPAEALSKWVQEQLDSPQPL